MKSLYPLNAKLLSLLTLLMLLVCRVPEGSAASVYVRWLLRAGFVGLAAWTCYKVLALSTRLVLLLPLRS